MIMAEEGESGEEMRPNPDVWAGSWGGHGALCWCRGSRDIDELGSELDECQARQS